MVEQHRHNVMADRRIRMAEIKPMDGLPVLPLFNFRALGWACVTVAICAFLISLFVIGAK
jgi:hypothetical protein